MMKENLDQCFDHLGDPRKRHQIEAHGDDPGGCTWSETTREVYQ